MKVSIFHEKGKDSSDCHLHGRIHKHTHRASLHFSASVHWRAYLLLGAMVKGVDLYFDKQSLKKSVVRKRRDINYVWKIHCDNAPSHTSFIVSAYQTGMSVPYVLHPPYSLDLLLLYFFLFSRLKLALKSKSFNSIENIQKMSRQIHSGTSLRGCLRVIEI